MRDGVETPPPDALEADFSQADGQKAVPTQQQSRDAIIGVRIPSDRLEGNTFKGPLVKLTVITFITMTALTFLALAAGRTSLLSSGIIAFSSDETGNWDIGLMDLSHSLLYDVTRANLTDDLDPIWSPARGQLAFSSDRNGDHRTEIYTSNLDGSGLQLIASGQGDDWRPYWSPDGRQMVYNENRGIIQIVDNDGANSVALTYGLGPAWSPTDERIAFYADRQGSMNADIYLLDTNGRNFYNLTRDPARDWDPAWSPDGRQIAFGSSRDGSADLYVIDAVCPDACGTNVRRLTFNYVMAFVPSWSPDGQQILFESEMNGRPQIYVIGVDGSGMRWVADGRSPTWIPAIPATYP